MNKVDNTQTLRTGRGAGDFLPYIAVPAFLGFALVFAPGDFFFLAAGLILFALLELIFPYGNIAFIFLFSCSIFPRVTIPRVPLVSGAEMYVTDFIVLYLIAACVLRAAVRRIPRNPVALPLAVLVAAAAVNAAFSVAVAGTPLNRAGSEFRPFLYMLLGIALIPRIGGRRGYLKLEAVLRFVALFTAFAVCVQWASGDRLTWLASNIKSLHTLGRMDPEVFRIKPPGLTLMLVVFIITLARYLGSERNRAGNLFVLIVLGMGLTVSFHRYIMIAVALSAAIFIFRMPTAGISRPAARAAFLAAVTAALVFFLLGQNPEFRIWMDSLKTRVVSLSKPGELMESGSMQNRIEEYRDALATVRRHPLSGVGLGGSYRSESAESKFIGDFDPNMFVHNAYVMIQLKMGVTGLAVFLWLLAAYWIWYAKTGAGPGQCADPALHGALGVAFAMLLLINLVSASLMTINGAPLAGAIWALDAAICRPAGRDGGSKTGE